MVSLTGKTKKGKDRVKEQGKIWRIKAESETKFLLESVSNPSFLRWVLKAHDPDFQVDFL